MLNSSESYKLCIFLYKSIREEVNKKLLVVYVLLLLFLGVVKQCNIPFEDFFDRVLSNL